MPMYPFLVFLCLLSALSACQSEATEQSSNDAPAASDTTLEAQPALFPTLPQQTVNQLLANCDQIDYIFSDLGVSMKATGEEVRQNLQHIAATPVYQSCSALLGQAVFQAQGEIITIAQVYYQPPQCHYFVFEVDGNSYANNMTQAGITRYQQFQQVIENRKQMLNQQGLQTQ